MGERKIEKRQCATEYENKTYLIIIPQNLHFMKKIPPGAEASNILVGEVDFLNHQIVAFVRLSKATILGDITEVPVPTRFVFILLGPMGNQNKFHEIGRSIATLMSDEVRTWGYHSLNVLLLLLFFQRQRIIRF